MRLKISRPPTRALLIAACLGLPMSTLGQGTDPAEYLERQKAFTAQMEARGLAEDFKGVTTDGTTINGLFPIRSTGVSTAAVLQAAAAFLASLLLAALLV